MTLINRLKVTIQLWSQSRFSYHITLLIRILLLHQICIFVNKTKNNIITLTTDDSICLLVPGTMLIFHKYLQTVNGDGMQSRWIYRSLVLFYMEFVICKPYFISSIVFPRRSPGHTTVLSINNNKKQTFSWTNKVCVVPFTYCLLTIQLQCLFKCKLKSPQFFKFHM